MVSSTVTSHKYVQSDSLSSISFDKQSQSYIALENCPRCENFEFMNLPEHRGEDCKGMIINVIRIYDPKVDITFVRFHEWESVQFEQRIQLLRGLCIVKTETWYGQGKDDDAFWQMFGRLPRDFS